MGVVVSRCYLVKCSDSVQKGPRDPLLGTTSVVSTHRLSLSLLSHDMTNKTADKVFTYDPRLCRWFPNVN